MKKIDEKELHEIFNGIKNNDKNSFTNLYEKYYNLVYRIVFSILKNKENSEDVAQIIFSKIYQLPKDKLPEKYEASWLYKVSRNETLQYIRKLKNEVNVEEIYDVSDETSNIDEIIDIETYKAMLVGLNETEKEIVSLKVLSQFTFKKIGQMLQMPTGTVQWNYYKAVNTLKISLSSLAGFIIAFILGISTTPKKRSANFNKEDKIETDNTSQDNYFQTENSEEIKGEMYDKNDSLSSQLNTTNTTETIGKAEIEQKENYTNIGFFGVSFIFFIIFIIFFIKHQQKRKVKTSKS